MEIPVPPNSLLERVEILGRVLVLHWGDAQRSELMLDAVREACPCATCGGSAGKRGGGLPMLGDSSRTELQGIQVVGRYALQLSWRDGHDTGIYSFELLRSLDV
jgi:DUF971 family protein